MTVARQVLRLYRWMDPSDLLRRILTFSFAIVLVKIGDYPWPVKEGGSDIFVR